MLKDGKCVKMRGIFQDITERRLAEQSLRDSEVRYRMLFDLSADGIIVVDADLKKINYANKAMGDMLGYHPEELVGMALADIHPDGALPTVLAASDAQTPENKRLVSDIPCLRKDCAIIFADINATTMTIDGRRCVVGFFRDITDRKTAEELKKTTRELQAFNEARLPLTWKKRYQTIREMTLKFACGVCPTPWKK